MQKYGRVKEIAKITGLKERTIRAYVLNKKIPFIKANGCILFDLQEIDDWLESKKVPVLEESLNIARK
jgi:excisionase family DNA binding protein